MTYHTAAYALREYGENHDVINYNLDDVACTGNETKLVDCFHPGAGNYDCRPGHNEAAVICTGKSSILKSISHFLVYLMPI